MASPFFATSFLPVIATLVFFGREGGFPLRLVERVGVGAVEWELRFLLRLVEEGVIAAILEVNPLNESHFLVQLCENFTACLLIGREDLGSVHLRGERLELGGGLTPFGADLAHLDDHVGALLHHLIPTVAVHFEKREFLFMEVGE